MSLGLKGLLLWEMFPIPLSTSLIDKTHGLSVARLVLREIGSV